jgi:hypothetical protein
MTLAGPLLSRENNVKLTELAIQYKYNLERGNGGAVLGFTIE